MDKLRETGFTFSKKYGQNFLTDGNLLRAIAADAGITKADTVLEIGPGAGALTLALAARAGKVVAYEIDRRLEPVLDETLAGCDNVRVVFRDICDVTDDELADAAGSDYILAANLPYYITTPILFRFTECARPPRTMIVMVQKEVADRLTAAPGTPAYGALTASVALTYEARITRFVPRSLFTPVPNVDSAVVRLSFSPKCDDPCARTRAHPGGCSACAARRWPTTSPPPFPASGRRPRWRSWDSIRPPGAKRCRPTTFSVCTTSYADRHKKNFRKTVYP